jgi:broad specificity phosphatase PhoE
VSRRRIYLLRHAAVAYFDNGRPLRPEEVPLTEEGIEQARAAGAALATVGFDRVLTSGLPRTVETARIVAPGTEAESWPELRELEGGRLGDIPEDQLEQTFVHAFHGVVPEDARFLGGETIGSLFDRVLPALDRLVADPEWDVVLAVLHGGVNRAILSYALTGDRMFLGGFEQAPACINVLDIGDVGAACGADRKDVRALPARPSETTGRAADGALAAGTTWIVRAVNVAPYDPVHLRGRTTTMEELWSQFRNM